MKVKDNIAEEFNEFSKNYTEDMTNCVPYYLELLELFTKHLPEDFNPKTILDLGCGNGNAVSAITIMFPKATYTLVDAAPEMLELCKERFPSINANYIESYFNDFEFHDETYDLIIGGFSLHHCSAEDKQTLYNHIHKALKPKGIFMCSDLMINKDDEAHEALVNYWGNFVNSHYPTDEKWNWIMEHYDEFDNPNSIPNHLQWLNNAGFEHYTFNAFGKFWAHFKAYKN